MTRERCETCFFFQLAGFAGNGWCLHKDRARSADVRTLVRRTEIACRNEWGRTLWIDPVTAAAQGADRDLIPVAGTAGSALPQPAVRVAPTPIARMDSDQVIETRTVWAEKGLSA